MPRTSSTLQVAIHLEVLTGLDRAFPLHSINLRLSRQTASNAIYMHARA